VFKIKKQAIIDDIYKHGIFGKAVAYYVYTIEFQKRGLPHMHILIFLQPGDKISNPTRLIALCGNTGQTRKHNHCSLRL